MSKFAFISNRGLKKVYENYILKTVGSKKIFWDISKMVAILLALMISLFVYFRFISLSSTEGYFLRQANNELDSISFKYEILQMEILDHKQDNRSQLYSFDGRHNIVDVQIELVYVPDVVAVK